MKWSYPKDLYQKAKIYITLKISVLNQKLAYRKASINKYNNLRALSSINIKINPTYPTHIYAIPTSTIKEIP